MSIAFEDKMNCQFKRVS